MSQGKPLEVWDRQCVIRLKAHFDQERRQGSSVSTHDPAGRVAKALGLGRRSVQEMLSAYHKTGHVPGAAPQSKGKPPYRIKPALETVMRQRIRARNRQGLHVSIRTLSHWLSENDADVPHGTLGRTLQRMGLVSGKSSNQPALRERDAVLMARRAYLRAQLANRALHGGTSRPEVYLDASDVHVNHSTPRTWYFAEEGPWVHNPSGQGPRLMLVHALTVEGWVEGAQLVCQATRRTGD